MCVRIDDWDSRSREALLCEGWREIEILDVYRRKTIEKASCPTIHAYESKDRDALEDVVLKSGGSGRLYSDPKVDNEEADKARLWWFRRYLSDPQIDISVTDGATGFCAVKRQSPRARIEMIGVHPDYRGKGLGFLLVAAALDSCDGSISHVLAGTSSTNYAARRLYDSAEFFLNASYRTFHK